MDASRSGIGRARRVQRGAAAFLALLLLGVVGGDRGAEADVDFGSVCPVVGLGGPSVGDPGGGQATATTLNHPVGLAVDDVDDVVYVSERNWDSGNYDQTGRGRIRAVDAATGVITDVAQGPVGERLGRLALSTDRTTLYVATGATWPGPAVWRVYAVDLTVPTPAFTLVAGGGTTAPGTVGEPATDIQLGAVTDIEVSPLTGRLYIAAGPLVLELDGTDARTVVGGGIDADGNGVNPLTAALGSPLVLAFDPTSGVMEVGSNRAWRRIRRVTPAVSANPYADGTIATFAGASLGEAVSGDGGPAAAAGLGEVNGLAVDPGTGDLYVGATRAHSVRRFSADGLVVDTAAGWDPNTGDTSDAAAMGFADDVPAVNARFSFTAEMAILDSSLLVVDSWNNRVRRMTPGSPGNVTTFAGDGPDAIGPAIPGNAGSDALMHPNGLVRGIGRTARPGDATFYLADDAAHRVWKYQPNGSLTVIAGNGAYRDPVGAVFNVSSVDQDLSKLRDVAVSPATGDLYILEKNRVLQVDLDIFGSPAGISVVAGTGVAGETNGSLGTAQLDTGAGGRMTITPDGAIWVSGSAGNVRRILQGGMFGQVDTPISGLGPSVISGLASDGDGNLFIADQDTHQILFYDANTSVLTPIIGDGTTAEVTADGAPASAGRTDNPRGVAWNSTGDGERLVFSDAGNRVRAITPGAGTGAARWAAGTVTTLAGSADGTPFPDGSWGDGADVGTDPAATRLNNVVDTEISNLGDGRVLLVDESTGFGDPNPVASATNVGPQTVREIATTGCGDASLTAPGLPLVSMNRDWIDLAELPVGQIPFDLGAVAATPLRAVPLRASPLRASPLRAVPLRAVPLRASALTGTPLRAVTLSSVVLDAAQYPGGWPARLAGTPWEGVPTQNVRLADLLDDPATPADETSEALTATPEITLDSVDLSTSPLRAVSIASLALGSTPLRAVPLRASLAEPGVTDAQRFQAWCDLLTDPAVPEISSLGYTCASLGLTPEDPLLALEVRSVPLRAVPLRAVPLRAVDLSSSPLRAVPLRASGLEPTPLRASPLRASPLRAVALGSAPLRAVPLRAVPLRASELDASPLRAVQLGQLADPSAVASCHPACQTLGEAADADAIPASATIGDLMDALDDALSSLADPLGTDAPPTLGDLRFRDPGEADSFFGGTGATDEVNLGDVNQALPAEPFISLADVLLGLIATPDLPWEDIDLAAAGLDLIEPHAADRVPFDFVARVYPSQTGAVPVTVTLPAGWAHNPSFAEADLLEWASYGGWVASDAPPPPAATTDPQTRVQTLQFLLPSQPPSGPNIDGFSTLHLRLWVTPGPRLGTFQARATFGPLIDGGASRTIDSDPVVVRDEYEGGVFDNYDNPKIIQADRLDWGYLNPGGDTDYYRVDAPGAGTRTEITLSHLPADADLVVYEESNSEFNLRAGVARLRQQAKPLEMANPQLGVTGEPLEPQELNDVAVLAGKTVAAVSARSGTTTERVELINDGDDDTTPADDDVSYVIAVTSYHDATSPDPYVLRVKQDVPPGALACTAAEMALPPVPGDFTPSDAVGSVPVGTETLLLVNRERLAREYGTAAEGDLASALSTFAGRPEVNGVVVPVDADPSVAAAYSSWDASPCGLGRPNVVVREINDHVDAILAASAPGARDSVRNVVVVGGDEQIPMARLIDNTKVSNEIEYGAELQRAGGVSTPQTVALASKAILSDDPYASLRPLLFGDDVIYPPDWAVGRLVEDPTEIMGTLSAFSGASGRLDPDTALVTGYDFLTDGAQAVAGALGGVSVDSTLIGDSWTAGQLDAKLAAAADPPELASLNAHFDHQQLLPAGGEPLYSTANLPTSPGPLVGSVLFSMGCHSGTPASDHYLDTTGGVALDWAQAFAQQQAVWVANTGFGYGDTAAVAYSEKLMARFAAGLRDGERAGEALRAAKQRYLGEGLTNSYDAKALSETVFYGLPMYRVGLGTPTPPTPTYVEPVPDPSAGGLASTTRTVTPDLRLSPVQDDGSRYWYAYDSSEPVEQLRAKTTVADGRPIQPRVDLDVTAAGLEARGSVVTGLAMTAGDLTATIARPTVDLSANEPAVAAADTIFPSSFSNVTNTTGRDARSRLVLTPGQFVADDEPTTPANVGRQRRFTSMTATVYYADPTDPDDLAPQITATSGADSSGVTFRATVTDDTGSGPGTIRRVVVLYLDDTTWRSTELTETAPGEFTGGGPATTDEVDYLVQAVDASGNVGVSSNKARLFSSAAAPAPGPSTNGAPVVTAGTPPSPDALSPVLVSGSFTDLDASTAWTVTANNGAGITVTGVAAYGSAAASLPAYGATGTYTVTLSVCDGEGACGTATMAVTVTMAGIQPLAQCTILSFGQAVTWWGTTSAATGPVTAPVGPLNRFTPAPQGRGQPTVIDTGPDPSLFATVSPSSQGLTWTLGGTDALAMSARGCS